MSEWTAEGGTCAECKAWVSRIAGVFPKGAYWLPRRGGLICQSCAIRCACGSIVPSLNPFDATTDRVMCTSCVRQRLGPSVDRLLALKQIARKMCHGEGCPRADLCRRYMDAQPTDTYFLMSPVQHDGECTEFVANGWLRADPTRCGGAHPPPRCTWQCCIEDD